MLLLRSVVLRKEGTSVDTKQLLNLVQQYHDNKNFITNEETAKAALVIPFIRLL